MTFTAYLDGARWFAMGEWVADAQGRENGDGRQIRGEWCEVKAVCTQRNTNGARFQNLYEVRVEIPRYVRLDTTTVSCRYPRNPSGIVDQPYTFRYRSEGIGHRVTVVRIVGLNRFDDDDFQLVGQSVRMDVRLDFVRVSNLPMRDPVTGALLRAANRDIIRDA